MGEEASSVYRDLPQPAPNDDFEKLLAAEPGLILVT